MEEQYKIIKDYENYEVSNFGNVRNIKTGRILKNKTSEDGYLFVSLSKQSNKKHFRVHRLIAFAFIPNPNNKPFVDHIDNNRTNNNISNLRWATYSENSRNRSLTIKNKSGVKGVSWDKVSKKWKAEINGTTIGRYEKLEDAQEARQIKAYELYGDFIHKSEKLKTKIKEVEQTLEELEQEFLKAIN